MPVFIEMGAKGYIKNLVNSICGSENSFCYGIKQDRDTLIKDIRIYNELKYTNNIFEKIVMIAVTTLPNNNQNYNQNIVYEYVKKIKELERYTQDSNDVNIDEVINKLMMYFKNIMDEKKISEMEQKYWKNQVKILFNPC
jgi:hypothetical protein